MIWGVAIKRGGLICALPKPARHHNVIWAMIECNMKKPVGHGEEDTQGFMGPQGFLTRQEAAKLIGHTSGCLFSEDLW